MFKGLKLHLLSDEVGDRYLHHKTMWNNCQKCELGKTAHTHVFCRGTLPCDILFIGEAPGKTEDLLGEPFVGQAGRKVLDVWIDEAWLEWHDAYRHTFGSDTDNVPTWAITNIVVCRPCDGGGDANRRPSGTEAANCKPRLMDFLGFAKPKAIVLLGHTADSFAPAFTVPVLRLKHPAYILRPESGGIDGKIDAQERRKLTEFLIAFTKKETR